MNHSRITVVFILFFFSLQNLSAQAFTETASLTGTVYGNAAWGDYDNDGDLDAFVVGGSTSRLYRNNAGSFIYVATGITGIQYGSCAWSDYDNDGDLDLAITGNAGTKITKIYRNDGITVFTDIAAGLTGVDWSTLAWGDYDNDGKTDLLVTGLSDIDEPVAFLYHNDGNNKFTDSQINITPCVNGMVKWGDYNNDDLPDILMLGQDFNGNENTEIYRNTGNNQFTTINANLRDGFRGGVDWGDYDNDGDLDVLLGGQMSGTHIFRNDGNDIFTNINAGLPALSYCPVGWADYDNDGDLDVAIAGVNVYNSTTYTQLFNNTGNNVFTEDSNILADLSGGSITWGDYNGDGKNDLILTGRTSGNVYTAKIYMNDTPTANAEPTTPSGLQATVMNNSAILKWSLSTDSPTPAAGLSYNIRIGTTTNGIDILSPMSDITTSYRKISGLGNAMMDDNYLIKNLPTGTYYWSVQCVDPSGRASDFSSTGSFMILPTVTDMAVNFLDLDMGSSSWGDYDNDGDLDILLLGYNSATSRFCSKIYRNNGGGAFDTLNANLKGVNYGTSAWGDYDNDGDLDIMIAGATGLSPNLKPVSMIYRNNDGISFTDINAGLTGVSHCSGEWGDLDNDGDLDILLAGNTKSTIYRNDNGIFVDINAGFCNINQGTASWGDYDRDHDLDVIIFGTGYTAIYKNSGNGTFTSSGVSLPGGSEGSATWGDSNNDGLLDIFMTGNVTGDNSARIYKNNGNGSFTILEAGLRGVSESHGIWGDFNNDGYSDVYYTGRSGDFITKLYINNKDGTFTDTYAPFIADYRSKVSVGDYDNDDDLDFLITRDDSKPVLYRNNMNFPNDPPESPPALDAENTVGGVILSWGSSTDAQSIDGGLYYNIRVGTAPQESDIFTPMVTAPGNKRLLPAMGNTQLNTTWLIKSLPVDTYFWSVQAVDQSFTGGEWALEESFTVKNVQAFFSFDEVCEGLSTHFTDQSTATKGIATWHWDFGDGYTSDQQNPEHTYASANTYNVTLTITDTESSTDFITHGVLVKPKPSAGFTATTVCDGTPTTFTNTTNKNGLTVTLWSWDFGDGHSSLLENPGSNTYSFAGDYTVSLGLEASNGCTDEISKTVTVAGYPIAAVSADGATTFCSGQSVTLSTPLNAQYTYEWKRDGASVTGATSNSYPAQIPGSYTVTVTNTVGNCLSISPAVAVTVNTAPAAPLISAEGPLTFCQGEDVELSAAYDPDYSYQWKLNGGAVGANADTYSATASGTYSLVVTNTSNCSANSSNTVDVTVNPLPSIPTVNISGPTTFCQGSSVELSVTSTGGYSYQWENNGDAITGATSNTYVASSSGVYSLRITNASNCSSSTENVTVNVLPSPVAPTIAAAGSLTLCQDESVSLSVTNNDGYSYQWKLNGGAVGNNSNTYSASASGTYTLTVTNASACSADATNSVALTVNPKPTVPTVNISGPAAFCQGSNVELSVTSTPGYEYQWENNGTGITGAVYNSYNAQSSGNYTLRVTNAYNCSAKTENVTVTVSDAPPTPLIVAEGSLTFCQGDSVILSVTNTPDHSYQWRLNGGSVGTDSNQYPAKTSGSYDLVVSNSSGCSAVSVAPVTVTVNPMPPVSIITVRGEEKFCRGDTSNLSVPLISSYTYAWKKGTADLGITENSINVTESGEYSVVTDLNGCHNTSDAVSITVVEKPAKPDIDPGSYTANMCLGEDPVILSVDNVVTGYSYNWYKNETPVGNEASIEVVEAGNYYLEAVTDICTSVRDTAIITFAPAPPKPPIIARGPSVWLLSTTSKSSVYKWYLNGNPIPEADQNTWLAGQNYGLYRLAVANESGCFSFSDTVRIPLGITGIEDTDPFEDVRIYPNPTTGMFTIEMNNNIFGELLIDIYTPAGSKALNIKFEKTTVHFMSQIDLSGQSRGMYLVNLSLDKYRAVKKVMVE